MKIDVSVIMTPAHGKIISEDAFRVSQKSTVPFFVTVVDGHGPGHLLNAETSGFSQFVADQLSKLFQQKKNANAFDDIFDCVQKQVSVMYGDLPFGAVASCLCIQPDSLTIAQAGDCRLYRFDVEEECGYTLLTQDHCVENAKEMIRLRPFYQTGQFAPIGNGYDDWMSAFPEERLHYKTKEGNWSTSSLEPTRGFGDPEFHPAFTHVPEIRSVAFDATQEVLYGFCSDGGAKILQEVFKYTRWNGGCRDEGFLERVSATTKMFIPNKPEDDVTIILLRIQPNLPTS